MSLKPELDPRRCGIKPAPLKTTTQPRIVSDRTLRTLWAAYLRAEGSDRTRIGQIISGNLQVSS